MDAAATETLLRMAEQLDGKRTIAVGTFTQRRADTRVRRILTADALKPDAGAGRGQSIDVTVHGTLKTGVMAIGAETTGVTITSSAATWELDLDGQQLKVATKLNGRKAIISGRLRHAGGVEIKNRWVVKVRSIKGAHRMLRAE